MSGFVEAGCRNFGAIFASNSDRSTQYHQVSVAQRLHRERSQPSLSQLARYLNWRESSKEGIVEISLQNLGFFRCMDPDHLLGFTFGSRPPQVCDKHDCARPRILTNGDPKICRILEMMQKAGGKDDVVVFAWRFDGRQQALDQSHPRLEAMPAQCSPRLIQHGGGTVKRIDPPAFGHVGEAPRDVTRPAAKIEH